MKLYHATAYDTWGEYTYDAGIFSTEELAKEALLKNFADYVDYSDSNIAGVQIQVFTLNEEMTK